MSVYFTSDHHFGQATARSFYRRPFASVAKIDQEMIDRWNAAVSPGDADEVWHLGDFAVRQSTERVAYLLNTLHGTKHLIVGNNDDAMVTGCPAGTASSNMQKLPSMERSLCSVITHSGHGETLERDRSTSMAIATAD